MFPRLVAFTALFLLFISCSKELGIEALNEELNGNENPGPKATFSFISSEILDKRCATSGCHAGTVSPDLRSADAYMNIVNINSSTGMPHITPGNPDSSYLYLKVIGAPGINGSRMPRDRGTNGDLTQAQVDSIRIWIEEGALNN